jgi:formamidopyrimidine-DNA glycosylase
MAQSFGNELKHCINCGNVVSMLFVEHKAEIWCTKCWDEREEEEEDGEAE